MKVQCILVLLRNMFTYLENNSNLKLNNFFLGYSPERINPGDKLRKLKDIKKVTSGSIEITKIIVIYIALSLMLEPI